MNVNDLIAKWKTEFDQDPEIERLGDNPLFARYIIEAFETRREALQIYAEMVDISGPARGA